jgi:hypothetical protein
MVRACEKQAAARLRNLLKTNDQHGYAWSRRMKSMYFEYQRSCRESVLPAALRRPNYLQTLSKSSTASRVARSMLMNC